MPCDKAELLQDINTTKLNDQAYVEKLYDKIREIHSGDFSPFYTLPEHKQTRWDECFEDDKDSDIWNLKVEGQLEKKLMVLNYIFSTGGGLDSIRDLRQKSKTEPEQASSNQMEEVPMDLCSSLGLKLFFTLFSVLKKRSQTHSHRIFDHVFQKLPVVLEKLPPLALYKQGGQETLRQNIAHELFQLLETCLHTESTEVPEQLLQAQLASTICLAVKGGSLSHLLRVCKLLLVGPCQVPVIAPWVASAMQELKSAVPSVPQSAIPSRISSGALMSFGKGDHGKLGHGSCSHVGCIDGNCTENKLVPQYVESTKSLIMTKICSLSTHSVAITQDGELLTWGNGDKHRLGHGDVGKEYSPKLVSAVREKGKVSDVACGLGHTLALIENGQVLSWGNGANGRLGTGDMADTTLPTPISSLVGHAISKIFAGAAHSLAVTLEGKAFAWGKNNQGQCGVGSTDDILCPSKISFFDGEIDSNVVQLCGGWEHTLARTETGSVYSFGSGYKDSRRPHAPPVLGHGSTERQIFPLRIAALAHETIRHIACGWDHSLAVSEDGKLYTWGAGTNGKLGHGDELASPYPKYVESANTWKIALVEAGCEHSTAITDDGLVLCWGQGDSGRLGVGKQVSSSIPVVVQSLCDSNLIATNLAVGDKYNLILVRSADEKPMQSFPETEIAHKIESGSSSDLDASWIMEKTQYGYLGDLSSEVNTDCIGSSSTALFILANLARQAMFYDKGDSQRGVEICNAPYVVESSVETFAMLNEILSFFGIRSAAESQTTVVPRILSREAAIADEIKIPLGMESGELLSGEVIRFSVLWSSLKILQANMRLISDNIENKIRGSVMDLDKTLTMETKFLSFFDREIDAEYSLSVALRKIHGSILRLIETPIFSPHDDYYEGCGFSSAEQVKLCASRVQIAAVAVLRIGFFRFYSSPSARTKLMESLMQSPPMNNYLFEVLIERTTQDFVVAEYILNIYPKQALIVHDGAFDLEQFSATMLNMLQSCYEELRQSIQGEGSKSSKLCEKAPINLLSALQLHCLSSWKSVYECITRSSAFNDFMISYCTRLLQCLQGTLLLISDHQLDAFATVELLECGFFHVLGFGLLETLCLRSDLYEHASKLLPPVLELLVLVREYSSAFGVPSSVLWVSEFKRLIAVASTCFAKALVTGSEKNTPQDPSSKLDSSMDAWLNFKILAGGFQEHKGSYDNATTKILQWRDSPAFQYTTKMQRNGQSQRQLSLTNLSITEADSASFSRDLFENRGVAANFSRWMLRLVFETLHNTNRELELQKWKDYINNLVSPKATAESRSVLYNVLAVVLWHNQLCVEALQFIRCTPGGFESSMISPNAAEPPTKIFDAWIVALKILLHYFPDRKKLLSAHDIQLVKANCSMLLDIVPTYPVVQVGRNGSEYTQYTLENDTSDDSVRVEWSELFVDGQIATEHRESRDVDYSKKLSCVSSTELETILVSKVDITTLKLKLLKQGSEALVRSVGLDVLAYLIVSVNCSQTKISILQLLDGMMNGKSSKFEDSLNKWPHFLDGVACGGKNGLSKLQYAFNRFYSAIASQISTSGLFPAVYVSSLRALMMNVSFCPVLQTIQSGGKDFKPLEVIRESKILTTMGNLLANDGDILSVLHRTHINNAGEIGQQALHEVNSNTIIIHSLVWQVLQSVATQLLKLNTENPASKLCSQKSEMVELLNIVLTELSRVQGELEQFEDTYSAVSSVLLTTRADALIKGKPLKLNDGSLVKPFRILGTDTTEWRDSGFSISLWVRFDKAQNDRMDHANTLKSTFILSINSTKPETATETTNSVPLLTATIQDRLPQLQLQLPYSPISAEQSVTCNALLDWHQWFHCTVTVSRALGKMTLLMNGQVRDCKEFESGAYSTLEDNCNIVVGQLKSNSNHSISRILSCHVDDVYWHETMLNVEQTSILANSGTLQHRIKRRFYIDEYCTRLTSLLQKFQSCSEGISAMSSPPWACLLLRLVQLASPAIQSSLIELLQSVLPKSTPENLNISVTVAPTITAPAVAGSGLKAVNGGKCVISVADWLVDVVTNSFAPDLDRYIDYSLKCLDEPIPVPIERLGYIVQRKLYFRRGAHLQTLSAAVKLSQKLLNTPKWSSMLGTMFINRLREAADLSKPEIEEVGLRTLAKKTGGLITAVYSLGGFLELPHSGSDVFVWRGCHCCSGKFNAHFPAKVIEFSINDRTVVASKHDECNLMPHSKDIQSFDVNNVTSQPSLEVPVPAELSFDFVVDLLYQLTTMVPSLKKIIPVINDATVNTLHHQSTIGDSRVSMYAHLHSRLLKIVIGYIQNFSNWNQCLDKNHSLELLKFASMDTLSLADMALGKELNSSINLKSVKLITVLLKARPTTNEVENLSSVLWLAQSACNVSHPWWKKNVTAKILLLDGDAGIEDRTVKATANFPTVRLAGISINYGTGAWYFEVQLLTSGLIQIGWADEDFICNSRSGHGVGDNLNSFSFDGYRCKKWNESSQNYGKRWKTGDIIGSLLDTDKREISYYINGENLGIAFECFPNENMYPAVSLNSGQSIHFNFGDQTPFVYAPTVHNVHVKAVALAARKESNHGFTKILDAKMDSPSNVGRASTMQYASEGGDDLSNKLIENLVGMGFPVSWALRCFREAPSGINESSAIAWIIEQMEQETINSVESTFGNDAMSSQEQSFESGEIDATHDTDTRETNKESVHENTEKTAYRFFHTEATENEGADSTKVSTTAAIDDLKSYVLFADGENEICPTSITIDLVLSVLYSRKIVMWMLCLKSPCKSKGAIFKKSFLSSLLDEKDHRRAFIEFMCCAAKSERIQSLPHDYFPWQNSLKHSVAALVDEGQDYRGVLSLVHDLYQESIDVFLLAKNKMYLKRQWGSDATQYSPDSPNLNWAILAAKLAIDLSFKMFSKLSEKAESVKNMERSSSVLTSYGFCSSLFDCATFPNASYRRYAFEILSHMYGVVHKAQQTFSCVHANAPTIVKYWFGGTIAEFCALLPAAELSWLFSKRYLSEIQRQSILSPYLQGLSSLLATYAFLQRSTTHDDCSKLLGALDLALTFVDVGTDTITLSWKIGIAATALSSDDTEGATAFTNNIFVQYAGTAKKSYIDVNKLPLQEVGTFPINGLIPETEYIFRFISRTDDNSCAASKEFVITTKAEERICFDQESCGPNLEISGSKLTVKNCLNKQWNAVRGTNGFTSGCYKWEVKIDKCVSKNVFIGVLSCDAQLDTYVGSDTHGWGYLANKALWHGRGKLRSYGELYKEGDTIGVCLNMDNGTMSFSRNGKDLGVAVDGLSGELFPAVSLYNKDDQITISQINDDCAQPDFSLGSAAVSPLSVHISDLIRNLEILNPISIANVPCEPLRFAYDSIYRWILGNSAFVVADSGRNLDLNISSQACMSFGLFHNDVVQIHKGDAKVLGVHNFCIWYYLEDSKYAKSWNWSACQEIISHPETVCIVRSGIEVCNEQAADCSMQQVTDVLLNGWPNSRDGELTALMSQIAENLQLDSPLKLSPSNVTLESLKIASDELGVTFNDGADFDNILIRVALIRHINILMANALCVVNLDYSSSCWHPSHLILKNQDIYFDELKRKLIQLSVLRSDAEYHNSHKAEQDFPEISFKGNPSIEDKVEQYGWFLQVSRQLNNINFRDFPTTDSHEAKKLRFHLEGQPQSNDAYPDFPSMEEAVLMRIATELADGVFDLFIKCKEIDSSKYRLVIFTGYQTQHDISKSLSYYFNVGQLLGLAFRYNFDFPIPLHSSIWRTIQGAKITLKELSYDNELYSRLLTIAVEKWTENKVIPEETILCFEDDFNVPCQNPLGEDSCQYQLRFPDLQTGLTSGQLHYVLKVHQVSTEIRRGFCTAIPPNVLPYFSASALERMISHQSSVALCAKGKIEYGNGVSFSDEMPSMFHNLLNQLDYFEKIQLTLHLFSLANENDAHSWDPCIIFLPIVLCDPSDDSIVNQSYKENMVTAKLSDAKLHVFIPICNSCDDMRKLLSL